MSAPRVPSIWNKERVEFAKDFALTAEDHYNVSFRGGAIVPWAPFAGALCVVMLFIALIQTYDLWEQGQLGLFIAVNAAVLGAGLVLSLLLIGPLRWLIRRFMSYRLRTSGRTGDPITLIANDGGLSVIWNGQTTHCPWESFHAVEEEDGSFYFWQTTVLGYTMPARVFSSKAEQDSFREHLTRWVGSPPNNPPVLARMGDLERARLFKEQRDHQERQHRVQQTQTTS